MTKRSIIGAAAALALLATAAPAMATTAAEPAATAPATTELSKSDVRRVAKDHLREQGHRNVQVGTVKAVDDGFVVELENLNGIRVGTMKLDKAGKVVGG